ncbi:hypothetical protein [Paraburkholderia oxyphila]|uniref:hypothetical protein n=1 Tax=Paraburkholderia oxyphila TaxID=614212 RepID=UPI000481FD73|nr:hypothetical protein [Paraburkholderia oxyphila]
MSSKLWYLAIGAGAVGLSIVGAVAFLLPRSAPVPTTSTAQVVTHASPAQAMAASTPPASPTQAMAASMPPASPPATQFEAASEVLVVTSSSAAYAGPSADAPKFYPIKIGTPIQTVERSQDGKWKVALTENGQAVFVPAADLGPYTPSLPDDVRGQAKVIDTATLVVGRQQLALAGVTGEGGDYAQQLQALINSKGGTLRCQRQAAKYICDLSGVGDIARAALFNGAARPGPDAGEDYREQANAAQNAHRGIWR